MKKQFNIPMARVVHMTPDAILCNSVGFGGDKVEGSGEGNRQFGSAPARLSATLQ